MPDTNQIIREFFAEFVGTFILLSVGFSGIYLKTRYTSDGVLAYDDCGKNSTCLTGKGLLKDGVALNVKNRNMFILDVSLAFCSGLAGAILISKHVSGGHFNPSVTITATLLKKVHWSKILYYLPAQYLGSFMSTAFIHILHWPQLTVNGVDNTNQFLNDIITRPHSQITIWTAMLDGFLSGYIFNLFLFAINDSNANGVPIGVVPLLIFYCFMGIIITFCINCGAALNPARDLGPRLYVVLFRGFEDIFGDFSYCFWWLPQHVCITLGYYFGGLTYYSLFQQISPT